MNLPFNLYAFFRDTSLVMLAWFLMSVSFFIWGRFFANLLRIKITGYKGIIAYIWLGFTFCIFIFSIYHLFFPIQAYGSGLFYLSGIIVFIFKFIKKLPNLIKSIGILKLLAIVLTVFAAAAVSIQLPLNYDTGYYHLNSIRWNNEYHIITGLGNLHNRLGFNQLYFLYAASLNFHPYLNDYAYHAANGFLYALYATGMILSGSFIDLLLLCLFFFIPMPYYWINNPNPDIASTLIQIVAFRYLLEAFYFDIKSKRRICFVSFAAVLSALMVCLKLSNAVLVLGFGIATLLFNAKYSFKLLEKKIIGRSFIFIGILFAIWLLRGYIQTGYPAFPSSIGKISFDWTIPERIAQNQRNTIYASARTCGQSFDINEPMVKNNNWFEFWFKWNFFDEKHFFNNEDFITDIFSALSLIFFPMTVFMWGMGSLTMTIISIILIVIYFVKLVKRAELFSKSFNLINLLIVDIISIIIWFISVPDFRFANGMFIIFFTTSILLFKTSFNIPLNKQSEEENFTNDLQDIDANNLQMEILKNTEQSMNIWDYEFKGIKIKQAIKTAMMFYSFIIFIWCFSISYSMNEFGLCGIIVLKKLPMKTFITNSGLKVLVPVNGKQPWDSDLPATPEPEKGLELRGSSISKGFRIKD